MAARELTGSYSDCVTKDLGKTSHIKDLTLHVKENLEPEVTNLVVLKHQFVLCLKHLYDKVKRHNGSQ